MNTMSKNDGLNFDGNHAAAAMSSDMHPKSDDFNRLMKKTKRLFLHALKKIVLSNIRARRRRATIAELDRLNSHQLRDIGLYREIDGYVDINRSSLYVRR